MVAPSDSSDLAGVLSESQRLGFLGDRPVPEVIEHSRAFVAALEPATGVVIDIGSGGGVPGLVIAHDRTDLDVVLADRRAKRTDFLQRVVTRLGWTGRVTVINDDVARLADRSPDCCDAVVARGFGPPESTLRLAQSLVRQGGLVVISEPPSGDRWPPDLLVELGVRRLPAPGGLVAIFQRDGST